MSFWIVSALLAAAVAALLLLALLRRRPEPAPAASHDVQVYRDQLREVERDLARGTVTEEEAERVRLEVSRRLLEADRAAGGGTASEAPRAFSLAGAALVAATLAGAFALYLWLGAPGYPDLPLAERLAQAEAAHRDRPSQEEAEAAMPASPPRQADPRFTELMAQLRAAVEAQPEDLQGQTLLAVNEARLGNYAAARRAQERVIALKGDAATADDHADLADLMILAAGGRVTPEAEAMLDRALALDAGNGPARYYYGVLYAQVGRYDLAFRIWRELHAASPADAPWVPVIEAGMPELAQLAGTRWSAPERRGPTAEDVEAAADMSAEDRMAMIRGMVEGLSDRLATEGGPPADWARLVRALGVLGETEEASAIWTEARTVFADMPEALAAVRAAAEEAGVAE
jgi:cytochrome c-type biogenesis protein CcmH